MDCKECGFCGRDVRTPLVRAGRDTVFCCTSCFRAYQALHTSETNKKEAGKQKKKAATKSSRKKIKQHVRKQKRGR